MIQWNKGEPPKDGEEYCVIVQDEDEDEEVGIFPLICHFALGEWHVKPDCWQLSDTESIVAWSEINLPGEKE